MRTQSIFAVAAAAAVGRVVAQDEPITGELGDAQVVEGNPEGVVYQAVLPEEPWFPGVAVEGNVKGSITARAGPGGIGVEYTVAFSNLPQTDEPFSYHVHVAPVPENGNCTLTQAHLDPYIRGQAEPCDSTAPETCEVGDLSGKFGLIEASQDPFEATYIDPFSSIIEGQGAFFGNRSFVFHFAGNLTRISCANFALIEEEDCDEEDDVTSSIPIPSHSGYPVPPTPGHPEANATSSSYSVPPPTGVPPPGSPSSTESGSETVPTAAAAMSAVPFALLGAGIMAAVFGM